MSAKYKILIVDDEADIEMLIRQKFRRQIRDHEYAFLYAQNGVDALRKLQEHPDLDLVFSDINMPEMDGLRLLQEISALNPQLRTVMISAYGDMANIRQAMNRGAFDFIGKPLDFEDFERTLHKGLQFAEHFKNSLQAIQENSLLQLRTQELAKKNQEIELLLKEIHHRVKNNLQTISSLLNLQSATITDPEALKAVQESQDRVQSMSLIHQKLYQDKNLATVEMKDYLETLAHTLLGAQGELANRVQLHFPMTELELDLDTAIPVGLIANELITNSLKYAFPEGQVGSISIGLNLGSDQCYTLHIADDGVGSSSTSSSSGFGSRLIGLLSIQLGGNVQVKSDRGVEILVRFPA